MFTMADPDVYPPCARQDVQALLTAMLGGAEFFDAVQTLSTNFHPSFFLELDWQELRLDRDYSEGPGIYEIIDDFAFAFTLPQNIFLRARPNDEQRAAFAAWVDSYKRFFEDWRSKWPDPAAYGSLSPELSRQAALAMSALGLPVQPPLGMDVEALVAHALSSLSSKERIFSFVRMTLSNELLAYLDHPPSRQDAKRFLRRDRRDGGGLPVLHAMPRPEDVGARELEAFLRARAVAAESEGLMSWGSVVEKVANRVRYSNLDDLANFDGNWSDSCLPCGRCSMWFAYEHIVAIDTRCSFVNWRGTNLTYLSAGLNHADCFFCGHSAPVESASLFYSPQRRQVVYCLPIKIPRIEKEEALELFRDAIQYMRDGYIKKISSEEARRFDGAAELLTYSLPDFLYAIQMGETVPEDHVYNFVSMPDGTGLLVDMSKGFARHVTKSEVESLTESGRGHEIQEAGSGPKMIVQEAQEAANDPAMTEEELLERMLSGLCDWIAERPNERAKGWVPNRPSAGH
jgi:hypothetical protein